MEFKQLVNSGNDIILAFYCLPISNDEELGRGTPCAQTEETWLPVRPVLGQVFLQYCPDLGEKQQHLVSDLKLLGTSI